MPSLRQRFHFTLLPIAAGLLAVTVLGYLRHQYYGDFFSYFVAMNNLVTKGSFEAFPYYENMLGVHSYFTLPLLTPFVWLFQSPFLFPFVSLLFWYGSSVLFFEICMVLAASDSADSRSPLLFGALFFSFPLVIHFAAPLYDPFQPDFFVVPLLLTLFWAMLTERRFYFYSAFFLLVFTKEEFIVMAPAFLFLLGLLFYLHRGRLWGEKKDAAAIAGLLLLAGVSSGVVLAHFRSLNEIQFWTRSGLYPELIWEGRSFGKSIAALSRQLGPIFPYLALLFFRADRRAALTLTLTLLLFPVARELLAMAIYSEGLSFYMHWRVVLPPTILLSVAVVTYYLRGRQRLSAVTVRYGLIAVIALNVGVGALLKGSVRDKIVSAFSRGEFEARAQEREMLRDWIGEREADDEVLILPEALVPWFYQRGEFLPSYTLFPWQRYHPTEVSRSPFFVLDKVEAKVRFVILDHSEPAALLKRIALNLSPVGRTDHYLVFSKKR